MRTINLYKATETCAEGERFWKKGDVVAVDWNAYDAAIGYNLTTGSNFNVFESGCWADVDYFELSQQERDNFIRYGL